MTALQQLEDDVHFKPARRKGTLVFGPLLLCYQCDHDGREIEILDVRLPWTYDEAHRIQTLCAALNALLKVDGSSIDEVIFFARKPEKETEI